MDQENLGARFRAIQTYPIIKIDPSTVIKPCLASHRELFVEHPTSSFQKLWKLIRNDGVLFLLKTFITSDIVHSEGFKMYAIRLAKIFAAALLQLHQFYSHIYAYLYPYSVLDYDVLCDEFAPCYNWSTAIIRAFAWHPNTDRCAVAICNDFIYIYVGTQKTRMLRHHHQKKIVDMVWHPTHKDLLAVATQTHVLFWTVDGAVASNLKIFEKLISPPITSIAFNATGDNVFVCSPNSTSIVMIKIHVIKSDDPNNEPPQIEYNTHKIWRFGQCITKLVMSPDKVRVAVGTTSKFLRVFETLQWSSKDWKGFSDVIQHIAWSGPSGRVLLVATKSETCLYAIPFFDEAKAYDVGGIQSMIKALDLSEKLCENDTFVGGRVQSFVWDSNGRRLAISFKDNPESILLFRTREKPSVEFQQLGVISSDTNAVPLVMKFHELFKDGSLLTICWSDGNCQHIPMAYSLADSATSQSNENPPQPLRSLKNFCLESKPISRKF